MPTYSRALFSGSTSGRPVTLAVNTNTTIICTVGTSTAPTMNEIYLWANNITNAPVSMTLRFGTGTSDLVCSGLSIPSNSPPIPILTGQNINGGVSLSGNASAADSINVQGYINVIS